MKTLIIAILGFVIPGAALADSDLCPRNVGHLNQNNWTITYTDDHSTEIPLTSHPCYKYEKVSFTEDTYDFTYAHFSLIVKAMKAAEHRGESPSCHNDLIAIRDILKGFRQKYGCEANMARTKNMDIKTTLGKDAASWTNDDRCVALFRLGEENDNDCHFRHAEYLGY